MLPPPLLVIVIIVMSVAAGAAKRPSCRSQLRLESVLLEPLGHSITIDATMMVRMSIRPCVCW